MEITTEYILCHILRIGCITGRAVVSVFNGRLNLLCTADPQNTLVIYVNTEVVFQVVPDAAVTFIRILHMEEKQIRFLPDKFLLAGLFLFVGLI